MKRKIIVLISTVLLMLMFSACDNNDNADNADTANALNNYWQYQTDLTSAMETHDATMGDMQDAIRNLGNTKNNRDGFAEIDAIVEGYVSQSNTVADKFIVLESAENNIVPYGDSKGLLSNIAKGIYNKAADTVISGGRMVRSGWRVLSGKQSIRQVLNDPQSGIPLLSG